MDADLTFSSRRSPVVCLHGCAASSQQLATGIGLDILKRGGNAADAAVAIAAALAVTEPCSTGPGGDAFCLFYNGNTGEITGLNGSGRSPRAQSLDLLEGRGYSAKAPIPVFHALNITVPGAPACWCDAVQQFGSHKLSLQEVLEGAVELAEVGFPVGKVAAHHWAHWVAALRHAGKELGGDLLIDGQAPIHGQVFRNPALAQTIKELGERGKPAFYQGRVAQAIIDVIGQHGGVMTLDDLSSHDSEVITPISTDYKGVRLWEPPPNSQGLAALLLLNILENFPLKAAGHNSPDYIHLLVEAVRLALTDALHHLGDPDHTTIPLESLLDKDYSRQQAQRIRMDRAMVRVQPGLTTGSDTVYFCVIDSQGNACSFVNSTYMGFGTGLVPKDCGFSLQNRGANFSLLRNHGNCVAGGKRPYHTIMPALLTDSAHKPRLLAALGVMGAFMQPQGHVQVLLNMLEFGMNPQQALDAPRVYVQYDHTADQWLVNLEDGVVHDVAEDLRRRGHQVNWPITGHQRSQFGRGQIITVGDWWNPSVNQATRSSRVLWAGSDPRADGCAQGY
ncbi:glutathione hydrolase-like YwrD proenzyme [Diretmus argenteus]